jgi:hypothetical protein
VIEGKLTRIVAAALCTSASNLIHAIRNGKLAPPPKDELGFYRWREEDIEAARKELAIDRRRRENRAPIVPAAACMS